MHIYIWDNFSCLFRYYFIIQVKLYVTKYLFFSYQPALVWFFARYMSQSCSFKMRCVFMHKNVYKLIHELIEQMGVSSWCNGYSDGLRNRSKRFRTPVALLRSLSGKYPWERYETPYPPSYGLNSTTTVLLGEWLWH